jgi:hypothetical protein
MVEVEEEPMMKTLALAQTQRTWAHIGVTPDFPKKTKCYLYVCQDLVSYI